MYVKVFQRILDSSLAEDRNLRHFFIDLLLCCEPDGSVIMTPQAIKRRIGASSVKEVEDGIERLMQPDPGSLTPDHDGRRLIPMEGHGYGWKIVNFEQYRDIRTAEELRRSTADRVAKYRENLRRKKAGLAPMTPEEWEEFKATKRTEEPVSVKPVRRRGKKSQPSDAEQAFVKAFENGDEAAANQIVTESLPKTLREPVPDPPDPSPEPPKVDMPKDLPEPEHVPQEEEAPGHWKTVDGERVWVTE